MLLRSDFVVGLCEIEDSSGRRSNLEIVSNFTSKMPDALTRLKESW